MKTKRPDLIGNQYGKGNKGGGRKPLAIETQVLRRIAEAFEGGLDIEKLKRLIAGKKKNKNLTDHALIRALESDKVLLGLLKKLVPDKQKIETQTDAAPIKIEIVKPDNE